MTEARACESRTQRALDASMVRRISSVVANPAYGSGPRRKKLAAIAEAKMQNVNTSTTTCATIISMCLAPEYASTFANPDARMPLTSIPLIAVSPLSPNASAHKRTTLSWKRSRCILGFVVGDSADTDGESCATNGCDCTEMSPLSKVSLTAPLL